MDGLWGTELIQEGCQRSQVIANLVASVVFLKFVEVLKFVEERTSLREQATA
jgi:hypothetical protein